MRKKPVLILSILSIIILATLIRCLHLLRQDHYYIISPDSHFFHWQAERVLASQPIPVTLHSGLTYPLTCIAKVLEFIFPLSSSDALTLACKLLPLVLAAISIIVIYLIAAKIYDWRVGIFAALTWAILYHAYFIGAAGYIDRDGLSLLLIMLGAFLFYLSKDWHFKIGKRDVGWIVAGFLVAGIGWVTMWEWEWVGGWIYAAILVSFVAAQFLNECLNESEHIFRLMDSFSFSKEWLTITKTILARLNWRVLVLFIVLFILGNLIQGYPVLPFGWGTEIATEGVTSGKVGSPGVTIDEMQGLNILDIFSGYQLFLIPILVGLVISLSKKRQADLFCISWFLVLFFLSFFARRVIIFCIPAACLLSGLGLRFLWSYGSHLAYELVSAFLQGLTRAPAGTYIIRDSPLFRRLWKAVIVFFLIIQISLAFVGATYLGSLHRVAASNDWYDALIWLRATTPEDARIMSWWDNGYWILDLAHREPLVDNGILPNGEIGFDRERLQDIGLAYCTSDASQAVQIMQKHDCDYLIFSRDEVTILPKISEFGLGESYGDGSSVPGELHNSLYYQTLWGNFQVENGLEVVYRPENSEIAILGLE